ncbi:UPF0236 family protein [Mycoplasmopsis arginini]|uniref:UPF0236 family protein n=1 Tax=Mycoplasmopsis arginini TaxID=2094 RepID=A0ABZ2AMG6_MYCAR|nr:UPF0236 family protein [Mycoplasmopsis arginini]WVN22223.1 UPF0236 family protein [Mycoplasmopsis arginini]VEU81630.1 Uncharacterised protein [Mycoplasmopsis arginini]
MKNQSSSYNNSVLSLIKNEIEQADLNFRNSKERKELHLQVHSKLKRKITTTNGVVVVFLTKYIKKVKGEPNKIYVFDRHLLLENNKEKINLSLYASILNDFLNGYSYRENAKKHNVSIGKIWRTIKYCSVNKNTLVSYQDKLPNSKENIVYISVDDAYHKFYFSKNHVRKIKFKLIIFYMLSCSRKMINKNHFLILRDDNNNLNYPISALTEKIKRIILNCYGENVKLVVTGDGASWIKNLAIRLKAEYILCRFHLKQKLGVIFNNSKELKSMLDKYYLDTGIRLEKLINRFIFNQNYEDLIRFLENSLNQIKDYLNPTRLTHLTDFLKYIKRNLKGLLDVPMESSLYFGNVAESFVSHLIKKKIKRNWTIYSVQSIMVLLLRNQNGIYLENYIDV